MNIQELNQRDQEVLMKILDKPIDEVQEHEAKILRARRSYLSKKQLVDYKQYLEVKQEKAPSKSTANKKDNKKTDDVIVDPEMARLVSDAEELGIKTEGMTKEDIVKAIDTELAKN